MYRLKAKLENAQGEQESLRQEMERVQTSVTRVHADRDKVNLEFLLCAVFTLFVSFIFSIKTKKKK